VSALTAIKSFYKANWRELNSNVGSKVEAPEAKARTPTLSDLVQLENSMASLRDKALIWFLESTAVRAGTAQKLVWGDLKPTGDELVPYYFIVESSRLKGGGKGKYKGIKQICFVHHFAVTKLNAYKKELQDRGFKIEDDKPLFMSYHRNQYYGKGPLLEYDYLFNEASLMAWQDLERKRFSPHDMRDVLQKALENARVNPNVVSVLMAHKVKGVDKHYSHHEIIEFKEAFKAALPWLVPKTVEDVEAETMDLRKENEVLGRNLRDLLPLLEHVDDFQQYLNWKKAKDKKEEQESKDEIERQTSDKTGRFVEKP
jgi:hypothetical protein